MRRFTIRKKHREDGAALVEMALITPLLLLLLFGIIEFSWLFSQNLDVRHGAREGARLAAVNYPVGPVASPPVRSTVQTAALVAEICGRMDVSSGGLVSLASAGGVGDPATVTVAAPGNTLTGFLDWLMPSNLELSSTVEIRMEQYAGWDNLIEVNC